MPMKSFHSCRLNDPGKYQKIRYKKQDGADVVMGMKDGGDWEVQAIRYPKDSFDEAAARTSCGKHGGSFEAASGMKEHSDALLWMGQPMEEWPSSEADPKCFSDLTVVHSYAKDLRGVEIFSSGTWNGDVYNERDLDAMVSAFHSLGIKPPLKLGHDEAQKWFGQKDGAPALGWVANLRRFGKKLVADLVDVPDALHGMITSKRYRTKSAEVYWDYKDGEGRIWPRVLRAVALLGADLPAVSNLQDLQMALMADGTRDIRAYGSESNVRIYYEGGQNMEEKHYQEKITSLEAQLESERSSRAEWETRAIRAESTLGNRDEEFALKQFRETVLPALKKDGKVLPAEEESLLITFSALGPASRKYGDKDVNPRELFVKSLQERKAQVKFGEGAEGGEEDGGDKPPAIEVDSRIRKFIEEGKAKNYGEGKDLVKLRCPDLWARYIRG
jgi:hypothetical protein